MIIVILTEKISIFWSERFIWAPCWWYTSKKPLFDTVINWFVIKQLKIFEGHLYTIKPFPDNSLRLKDCTFGGSVDLVMLASCLVLGLCLLDCNLDFLYVLGIYIN